MRSARGAARAATVLTWRARHGDAPALAQAQFGIDSATEASRSASNNTSSAVVRALFEEVEEDDVMNVSEPLRLAFSAARPSRRSARHS